MTLTFPAATLVRLWDQDFNLEYTFSPGEDHNVMAFDSVPAGFLMNSVGDCRRTWLTADLPDGTRWSGLLDAWLIRRNDGTPQLEAEWCQHVPQQVHDHGSPFDEATQT